MAERKVSQLPQSANYNLSDLMYIIQDGLSKKLPLSVLLDNLMQNSNNLSNLGDNGAARTNLGVLSSAEVTNLISTAITGFISQNLFFDLIAGFTMFSKSTTGNSTTTRNLQPYENIIIFLDPNNDHENTDDKIHQFVLPEPSAASGRWLTLINLKTVNTLKLLVKTSSNAQVFTNSISSNSWNGFNTSGQQAAWTNTASAPSSGDGEYMKFNNSIVVFSDGTNWIVNKQYDATTAPVAISQPQSI